MPATHGNRLAESRSISYNPGSDLAQLVLAGRGYDGDNSPVEAWG